MRDIIFRALTSKTNKKQDVCVQEAIEKDGILAKTERRCRYFIMDKVHVESIEDVGQLSEAKFNNVPYKKRHYYVLKIHNNKTSEDRLLCKIAGTLYAVFGKDIYCIAYVHSFRITFTVIPSI